MHAIKGSWSGQAIALANNNDSVERKSRIRLSKEERKAMAEAFIKKYQKSNNGNFPSLNLAHKKIGGSFYTVREIIREIIQENRVLAPPKISSEEHNNEQFLEQHPLGSISMEPQTDLPVSDSIHVDVVTHIIPPKYEPSNTENISTSSEQLNGSFPLELDKEQAKGRTEVADNNEDLDRKGENHQEPNDYLINNDEKIVNGVEILEESPHFDNSIVIDIDQSGVLANEHCDKNDEIVDKNKEFVGRIDIKSAVTEILDDKEGYGAQDVETIETVDSHLNSNVVELFPLGPVPRSIHDMDGDSGELQEVEDGLVQRSSGFANVTDKKNIINEKAPETPVNLQSLSLEDSVRVGLDIVGEMPEPESWNASPKGTTKASTEYTISEDSTLSENKAILEDSGNCPNRNSPTLNRINLETWEGTSKKSNWPQRKPLLAIVRAFFSSFMKFWT